MNKQQRGDIKSNNRSHEEYREWEYADIKKMHWYCKQAEQNSYSSIVKVWMKRSAKKEEICKKEWVKLRSVYKPLEHL